MVPDPDVVFQRLMDGVYRNGRTRDEKSRKNRESVLFPLAGLKRFGVRLEGSSGEAKELRWVFDPTQWTALF
jgi:hypothetical protein